MCKEVKKIGSIPPGGIDPVKCVRYLHISICAGKNFLAGADGIREKELAAAAVVVATAAATAIIATAAATTATVIVAAAARTAAIATAAAQQDDENDPAAIASKETVVTHVFVPPFQSYTL